MANKIRRTRRGKGELLDAYRAEEPFLFRADKKSGRPSLIAGTDDNGSPVLIKMWHRIPGQDDLELREIWQHEIRQLYRLGGYPGAARTIAGLNLATFDEKGFYLVLDLGQRRPVEVLLKQGLQSHWLRNPRIPANRARLWRNIAQLASGLEILHSQGLLHRNIDRWSVLASGGHEIDFQLTGFEWSLRLTTAAHGKQTTKLKREADTRPASFLEDWRSFGVLCADLLGASEARIIDMRIAAFQVADHLSADEARLLRQLVRAERLDRLDGEFVQRRVQEIVRSLEAEVAGVSAKFYLTLRLGTGTPLSERIRELSNGDIETSDREAQLKFVASDLSQDVLLLGLNNGTSDPRLVLRGANLAYSLTPFRPSGANAVATWDMAYCDHAEGSDPAYVNIVGQTPVQANALEIMSTKDANERLPRLRGKLSSWTSLQADLTKIQQRPNRFQKTHQALALTQFLEALFAAADAFPVDLVPESARHTNSSAEGDQYSIGLALRADSQRDALSTALGLRAPSKRFEEALFEERRSAEWVLTEARYLGEREFSDTTWRFAKKETRKGASPVYIFTGSSPVASIKDPILISSDHVGRDIQLRRRIKALGALSAHSELLSMIVDPRIRILDSHEAIKAKDLFEGLDESKQKAMKSIVETVPLFLVQGPPGVGKTRLVRELVRDAFLDDATARLLLTAQSNSAVNHLMHEIDKALGDQRNQTVIVRCQPKENKEDAGKYEIKRQTQELINQLAKSPLAREAPPALQRTLHDLITVTGTNPSPTVAMNKVVQGRLAMEGLLVRGANIVFATTNSHELERLIEEKGQFDWVIVEEAGKANGGELLAALLLSYRRLMIGDHRQLAPYGSQAMIQLLGKPESVRIALKIGAEFIGKSLRDPSTDEVLDELEAESPDFEALCSTAIGCVLLFERLIEEEFRVQKAKPTAKKVAQRLTLQHRMHPAIAQIVSNAFYEGDLKSHPDTEARFSSNLSPVTSVDPSALPAVPIVFVDMPWIQSTMNMRESERYPRWHNPDEVAVVLNCLRLLKVTDGLEKPPTLAVLSPYSEQVRRLKNQIGDNLNSLPILKQFSGAPDPLSFCKTVDSFQGHEADAVIVSLVRNNHHTSARRALGFLSDFRRMNVLLSRAQWRMIVVGSIAFLRSVLITAKNSEHGPDLKFLQEFLDSLEAQRKLGAAAIISAERLVKGASK
ncbi:hypothetical protein EOA23_12120 [Mesorhizobium sp. M2A.F.Ca.ET.042.01.1.1]|uniref:AAA domain-containing protein n=1 Tax=Mesorhizobium sp. M2A.F.Ca.ET.042.01.1.1 TaxID=2496745 RepID=UPI000FCA52DA|nr:AAA domain-containing protein [Mesorhizobium sp. M2A.F.Ca.ET.042.01.1.1]RUX30375.1 hypothetical protein EOA23_12120 [Mesorhizobium sp. M2A.F.Ca.ET.042.01.1.1]